MDKTRKSNSLRGIRILFDEKLRKSLFNYLSYRLGLGTNQPERAVKFRDRAINEYPDVYGAIEKLYDEGKLTGIILDEAIIQFRKCKGKPSTSDMKEFSTLVKKTRQNGYNCNQNRRNPCSKLCRQSS